MNIHDLTPADIVAIRKKARLNQTEFGQICGVSKTSVVNWEKAIDDPVHSDINGAAAQLVLLINDDVRIVETLLKRARG